MIKKHLHKVIAGILVTSMAATLAVGMGGMQDAQAASQVQYLSSSQLSSAGWRSQGYNSWVRSVDYEVGSMTGGQVIRIPMTTPYFDSSDRIDGNYGSGIIRSVYPDYSTREIVVTTNYDLRNLAGRRETVSITNSNVLVDYPNTPMGMPNPESFRAGCTLQINISVKSQDSPDPKSIQEGWVTTDNGRTYTRTYDTYEIGEGAQGSTISVTLPHLSTYGFFTADDYILDTGARSFIRTVSMVDNMLYLTLDDNLTPFAQTGTNGTITFSKTIKNDQGVNASYTLTIPLRVTNLSSATVNGWTGPAVITVTQGDTTGLRVANIDDPRSAVVHWTTNSSGYIDAANLDSMPKINSNGMINIASLQAGTYYFYIRSGKGLETRMFILQVEEKGAPAPTPSGSGDTIYRLYHPVTGEHLYTTDTNEVANLTNGGWQNEGTPGKSSGSVAVYRLYNRKSGEHLYTADETERITLTAGDWVYDNNQQPMFYAGTSGAKPMYRLYNPRAAVIASHHYTSDSNEVKYLTTNKGWQTDNAGAPVFYLQ